ncbi:putative GTPase [bioreactor metagenome]|uniref:Putative GTPase n=1 Tax=bioreactor metagenome TaxID=1076179 RepID=A0A645DKR9_9ZZZZ|nr:methylmalonyl Co-A mutase-associated GTPase MeaB [Aminivibrio sp.]MDD3514915.1 methylmalonyl Co-A mutase-associated GTPase MeaB [Synergistaceae bacterium]NCB16248.1 methylmalonyl Co-A mutase-associated GTPase MeaB [Synergistales bacterium]HPF84967.1 methylmalonyl Co-A mutase-associated GTPase MeaB [Aminivibrio sp.]HRX27136.1 methylmalonyl Co-A mutase-associated GTPase MeaB [Aminivibrio sp.]
MDILINKALAGDMRAIARIISLIENGDPIADAVMRRIYPLTGKAMVIGITGSPGAGKSTLTDKLIESFRKKGKTVGIIAVDPSSPFSGGAILADRIRMQRHTGDEGVYIRSMGTRGSLGGLSRGTREAVLLLDACGKDVIIIETVGVGQSEVDIIKIADTVCVVLVPGMGDDIQIMKAGIMEIANVFAINKADKPGVDRVAAEVRLMLELVRDKSWTPPVHLTVAENGTGVEEFAESIVKHHEFIKNSPEGARFEFRRLSSEVEDILLKNLTRKAEKVWRSQKSGKLMEDLAARKTNPYTVASDILRKLFPQADYDEGIKEANTSHVTPDN